MGHWAVLNVFVGIIAVNQIFQGLCALICVLSGGTLGGARILRRCPGLTARSEAAESSTAAIAKAEEGGVEKPKSGRFGWLLIPLALFGFRRSGPKSSSDSDHTAAVHSPKIRWTALFPAFAQGDRMTKRVEFVAIGKRSGDLMLNLAPRFPEIPMAVMETRPRAVEHLNSRVATLRQQNSVPNSPDSRPILSPYQNITSILGSGVKTLPSYFAQNQLTRVFISFPDLHPLKRMASTNYDLAESYGQVVQPGGCLYVITDCTDVIDCLHQLFNKQDDQSPGLWEVLAEDEWRRTDDFVTVLIEETARDVHPSETHVAVWRRKEIYT